jgi:hypothetical protein
VSIENMEVLEAPTRASPVDDVRAFFEDQALATVTTTAGAVSLVFYCAFVVALVRLLRERAGHRDPWSELALAGGLAGPLVATAALVATALLTADGGLSDDRVADLFDFSQRVRVVSGIFVAMFLGGVGVTALRSKALPTPLSAYACALAVPMAVVPFAALSEEKSLAVAVGIVFALQTLWIFFMSLWLLLADGVDPVAFIRRSAFLLLVMAAGLIGIALVAVPAATAEFFAWDLAPEPLAAFAGGVYVGSAFTYAVALPRGEREVRGLVLGAVVLSVSVFVITVAHLDLFDFDRLQAWTWVALFGGFSVVTTGLLVVGPPERWDEPSPPLSPPVRLLLAVLALVLGALALALWIEPTELAGASPFELPPLGGRFAGSWVALLAVLAGWAAVRNRVDEARLSAIGLVLLPAGALVAALRTISDLEPAGGYLAVLALLLATGAVVLWATASRLQPPESAAVNG